jgi:hypothetical protein
MLVAADPAAVPLDDVVAAQYSRALDPETGKIDFNSVYGSILVPYIAALICFSALCANLGFVVVFGESRRLEGNT